MRAVELRILEGRYAVWKLPPGTQTPDFGEAPFLSITRTAAEVSIVGPARQAPDNAAVEADWTCLEVQGPLGFELTGVVAALSAPLAAAGVPIFVVSTFDTDYLLVKTTRLERAVEALKVAGHRIGD